MTDKINTDETGTNVPEKIDKDDSPIEAGAASEASKAGVANQASSTSDTVPAKPEEKMKSTVDKKVQEAEAKIIDEVDNRGT